MTCLQLVPLMFILFLFNKIQAQIISAELHSFGNRIVILVAFGGNYTYSNFRSTMHDFIRAFNCPARHQFVTIYFGDLSMKIDCDYRTRLVDCVNNQIFITFNNAYDAFQVSYL